MAVNECEVTLTSKHTIFRYKIPRMCVSVDFIIYCNYEFDIFDKPKKNNKNGSVSMYTRAKKNERKKNNVY